MKHIVVHEVGPRDGLQMERQVVPTDTKEDWIRRTMESGVDIVQVGSFVHPVKVPQMADSDELIRRLVTDKPSGVTIAALALNERGVVRGMECGVEMFCLGASASETHSRRNTGMSSTEATRRIVAMGLGQRPERADRVDEDGDAPAGPEAGPDIGRRVLLQGFQRCVLALGVVQRGATLLDQTRQL